ncbi:MAG: response regulator transcription factor [Anaerolineales bacterium]|nr:response regulator transcription factor [Anaerolineales bacterium]MCA9929872.1 response regulator transcription factor [Anaerolineales bacterium]
MQPLRLLIVADDPLARAGLSMLLTSHPDCEVVGQFSGADLLADVEEVGETAVSLIWDLGWDFDGELPDWQEIGLPIIALLPDDLETAPLWATGVGAMLSRSSSADAIMAAARAVRHNLVVFDPAIIQLTSAPLPEAALAPIEDLTPRETEVIQLIAEGMTNKAIAQQLDISAHTVKFHVNAIMNKLAAQSRTEAVVRATRMGLISL